MKEGLERSLNKYIKVADFTRSFFDDDKNPLPVKTHSSWRILLTSMRLFDHELDNASNPFRRSELKEEVIRLLERNTTNKSNFGNQDLDDSANVLASEIHSLPEASRSYFLRNLKLIFNVTEKIRNVDSAKQLAHLTRLEGQLTSHLFLAFLPQETKTNLNFIKKARWFKRLGRLGNLVDSTIDMTDDYQGEEILVKPTAANRVTLIKSGITDTYSVMRGATWRSYTSLGDLFLGTLQNNSRH